MDSPRSIELRRHIKEDGIREHVNNWNGNVTRNVAGCFDCRKAGSSVNLLGINFTRAKEAIARALREIATNSELVKAGKCHLEWSRGILLKKESTKPGFELKISTPNYYQSKRDAPYGDLKGPMAWATRLIVCNIFMWEKSKLGSLKVPY